MISDDKIRDLITRMGSPLYVFDLHELSKRVLAVKKIFGHQIEICYAMKANPFLLSYMTHFIDRFEVCSPGEYSICMEESIPSEKIVLSGVYKNEENVLEIFSDDFNGVFTIESLEQFRILKKSAHINRKKIKTIIRLTSGNQFGLDEKDACKIISEIKDIELIELSGLQYFTGTQKKNITIMEKEIDILDTFCDNIFDKYGMMIKHIEYGAGLFYDYFSDNEKNYSDAIRLADKLSKFREKYQFTLELGRYLTASCGQYVTKVVDTKKNHGKNYCIVDGGIHHLNYYGQMSGIKVPSVHILRNGSNYSDPEKWNVCGALCTVNDILLKDFETCNIEIDDVIVFNDVGAYSVTETSCLFLSRDLPLIAAASDSISVIRNRTSIFRLNMREVLDK